MEKKGRSLGSGKDFRKKKTGTALPLGVFLSFNDRDVHPQCPDASNPYHKCGRHCLHKIPSAKNFFDAETFEGGKMSEGRGVNPNCPNASNPFHKCAEYCFERLSEMRRDTGKEPAMKPKEEKKAVVIADRVNSECKNASNPYHVCAEYCFQNVLERDQPGQVRKLKSRKQLRKIVSNIEITSMGSQCKYASNPYHECDEFCFRNEPDRNKSKGEKKSKGVSFKSDTSSAHPHHNHTSRPYDEDAEIFIKNTSEKEHCEGAMKPILDNRTVITTERGEFSECKNASNLHHVCSEYCFQALPEKFQCGEDIVKAKEDRKVSVPIERTVNPVCRNASNPYHVCAEYCFQNPESHQPGRAIMKSNEDKGAAVPLKIGVNQVCKNASNPYHVCAEYCFQNVPERHKPVKAMMKSKEEKEVVAEPLRRVNPDCKYASNPYHVCAEYCFQNAPEREQQGKVMKLRSRKQLNKTVSNMEMTSVHPRCRYASNPYHECAEYCFQKNVPGRQISEAVMMKEKKANSPKKETINHPMMENSSMASEYVEVSSNKHAESSGEIIVLQDRMEKSSMEPKDVEQLSPNNNDTEFCEGIITMQDETNKVLHSEVEVVEMKNRKEPAGVQPLPIDASDLFQEWAKYCFQEKFAEGIIVMQDNRVERREITTTNDKGDVVLNYESSNLEKVQAKGSSPRSRPASVLFFVGFLFSMFYWTQVIHSLVMSSEKNKGPQRLTRKIHDDDAKCSNVSDPYHKCSECCF